MNEILYERDAEHSVTWVKREVKKEFKTKSSEAHSTYVI
jgi:hypothetical protein